MKKIVLILPLIALLSVSCNNNNDADNRRIQELEDKIAQLENNNSVSNTAVDNVETNKIDNTNPTFNDYVGTWELIDKNGNKFQFNIEPDKTATVIYDNGKVEYGSAYIDYTMKSLSFHFTNGYRDNVCINFPEGVQGKYEDSPQIRDGWFYNTYKNAKAKNPNWRLPIKKVK